MFHQEMKVCYYIGKNNYGNIVLFEGFILLEVENSHQVEIIRSAQQTSPLIHDFIDKKFVFSDQILAVKMLERIKENKVVYPH